MSTKPFRTLLRRFKREDGAVSVEAPLWVFFFFVMLLAVADMALMFHGQARVLRIVQDENRLWAAGYYADATEVEEAIKARLSSEKLTDAPQALSVVNDSGIIKTQVTVAASDIDAVGVMEAWTDLAMTVRAQHIMEN